MKLYIALFFLVLLSACASKQPTSDEIAKAYYGNKPQNVHSVVHEKLERMFPARDIVMLDCQEPEKKWVNNDRRYTKYDPRKNEANRANFITIIFFKKD